MKNELTESESRELTSVTFWITKKELQKFDRIAAEKQMSRSALLRGAIIETNKSCKE